MFKQKKNRFDERSYFKKLFDEIDSNHDGRITGQELHEALRRGQPSSEFDPYTINTLIEKYDNDRDNQISFQEFYDLFQHLNAQYNEFLDFDADSSGFIDGRELANVLRRKGYSFSPDLFNYIVNEISRRSGKNGINFDTYVRVIARFDFLRSAYNRSPNMGVPLEKYVRDSFF
jgi:Ca2+-binding EF-hand superfamily protein